MSSVQSLPALKQFEFSLVRQQVEWISTLTLKHFPQFAIEENDWFQIWSQVIPQQQRSSALQLDH